MTEAAGSGTAGADEDLDEQLRNRARAPGGPGGWRPVLFDLASVGDRTACRRLLAARDSLRVVTTIEAQIEELVEVTHRTESCRAALRAGVLGDQPPERFGR
jgi:hypothetical protein